MKFIADVMLGRLAKRMRLLGFDVVYHPDLDDNEIIRRSLAEDRIILTRDTALAGRPLASHHLLITKDAVQEQLNQVVGTLHITQLSRPLTRCSLCNELLKTMSKQEALDRVPPHVYESHTSFFQCSVCRKVYWRGSHVQRMALPQDDA